MIVIILLYFIDIMGGQLNFPVPAICRPVTHDQLSTLYIGCTSIMLWIWKYTY